MSNFKCKECKKEYDKYSFNYGNDTTCKGCLKKATRKRKPTEYLKKIGVGERHISCRFDNFEGVESTGIKEKITAGLIDCILIQSVKFGNGKTHLAVACLLEFGVTDSKEHRFVNFSSLMLEIKDTFKKDGHSELEIVKKYSSYGMLVIDDIGAEKSSNYATSVLYVILNNRYESQRPTITTTNLTGGELVATHGKRVLSRLLSGYIVKLQGNDRRGLKI